MKRHPREKRLAIFERRTELTLLLLAFATVPAQFGQFLWTQSPTEALTLRVIAAIISGMFLADYVAKLAASGDRTRFLSRNWLEGLAIVVPILRVIRIVGLVLRSAGMGGPRRFSRLEYLVAYWFGAVVIAATVVTAFEQPTNPRISGFGDALWWSVVTVTTVGFGDITPVTVGGKITAGALMTFGVAMFSGITANIAARFMQQDSATPGPDLQTPSGEVTELGPHADSCR